MLTVSFIKYFQVHKRLSITVINSDDCTLIVQNRTTSVHGSLPFYRGYSPFRNSNRFWSKNLNYRAGVW